MEKNRKSLGKRNKNMGSNGERYYRDKFKELGYDRCVTSRLGSRLHDNAGVDLIHIPYNVQVKVGVQKGLKPEKELENISLKMSELFPKDSKDLTYPKIVIHKKAIKKFSKRSEFDEIVSMSFKDFMLMAEKIKKLEEENNGDRK